MAGDPAQLSVLALGVGAGRTSVYDGQRSSAFLVCAGAAPALLLDAGPGAAAAVLEAHPRLPGYIYVSHNHTDHAGEWGRSPLEDVT
jgi:glyoxylase-like metal-dependent hydrolase (beta-lactamase superfamily II)